MLSQHGKLNQAGTGPSMTPRWPANPKQVEQLVVSSSHSSGHCWSKHKPEPELGPEPGPEPEPEPGPEQEQTGNLHSSADVREPQETI